MCERARGHAPTTATRLVFPFTHIGGIAWLFSSLADRLREHPHRGVRPRTHDPRCSQRERRHASPGAGTPFHLAYLAAQRSRSRAEPLFPNVRTFTGGGAPKPPQLHYDVKAELGGVGIVSGYGPHRGADPHDGHRPPTPTRQLANTEGAAMPGVELRVGHASTGKVAGVGEEGEIRGPRRRSSCRATSTRRSTPTPSTTTGSSAPATSAHRRATATSTITGRLKDVIIRKGENISAKEVEDLLYTHPKVADVAVIGLPDPRSGRAGLRRRVARTTPVIRCSSRRCSSSSSEHGLSTQTTPEQLETVDAVPRNPAGKILKHDLRARYATP